MSAFSVLGNPHFYSVTMLCCLQWPTSCVKPQSENATAVHNLQHEVAQLMFQMLPSDMDKTSKDLAAALDGTYSNAQPPSEASLSEAVDYVLCQSDEVAMRLLGVTIDAVRQEQAPEAQAMQHRMVAMTVKKLLTTHAASGCVDVARRMLPLVSLASAAFDAAGAAALLDVLKAVSCSPPQSAPSYFSNGIASEVCQYCADMSMHRIDDY